MTFKQQLRTDLDIFFNTNDFAGLATYQGINGSRVLIPEDIATGDGATLIFGGTSAYPDLIETDTTFKLVYTIGEVEYTATADDLGVITGSHIVSASIVLATGVLSVEFDEPPDDLSKIQLTSYKVSGVINITAIVDFGEDLKDFGDGFSDHKAEALIHARHDHIYEPEFKDIITLIGDDWNVFKDSIWLVEKEGAVFTDRLHWSLFVRRDARVSFRN